MTLAPLERKREVAFLRYVTYVWTISVAFLFTAIVSCFDSHRRDEEVCKAAYA